LCWSGTENYVLFLSVKYHLNHKVIYTCETTESQFQMLIKRLSVISIDENQFNWQKGHVK